MGVGEGWVVLNGEAQRQRVLEIREVEILECVRKKGFERV